MIRSQNEMSEHQIRPRVRDSRHTLLHHTRTLLKQQVIPSGHDPSDYIARRLQARAKDGEKIPLTVLYHRTTPLDGSAPCVLDAYGAYGDSIPASFSTTVLSLVDRGVISVVAHIRGGQEKGRAWYEAAKGLQKQNSFDDFIAAGKALVEQGFTQKGRIVISGASAGGLTMGAVINQESDCLLYTSPSPRDGLLSRMPSSA